MPPIPEPADDMERYEEFRRMRTERMDEIVSLRQKMGDLVKELDRMPVNTMDIPFSNLKPWVGDTLKKKNELDKRDMELKTRYFQMQGEIREVEKEQLKLEKENRDKISTASNIFRGSFKTQRVRREKIDAALDKLLEVCGEEELRMRLEKRIAAMGAKGKALEIEEPDVPKELVQAMKENLPLAHSVKEWTIDAATTVIKETGKSLKKKRTEAGHSHSRSSSVAPDFETPSRVRFASPLRRQNPEPVTPRQLFA
ncbi:hypothetical protein G7Y89_g11693 [Cudoniella acicularis]|uniref:Uncharacterized protein n=1 Tax=Cudoniella acicularis TaxID=354080 RepID=A0A8H4RCN3_9HELO|nr:hypothetical protein G7Y89_g11693 [Cudoniella acicularis]